MSKHLAVSWDSNVLRYLLAESRRKGQIRVLDAGEKTIELSPDDDGSVPPVVRLLRETVQELKATRAQLTLCVGRGAVDSVRFTVPPAAENEVPTLVSHMAQRQLTGLSEDAAIDYVSFPPDEDGSRNVSAMAMAPADEQLVQQLAAESGCASSTAVVVTHPLRRFAPETEADDTSVALVVSKGVQSAHLVAIQHGRPVLSRTVRMAPGASREDAARFLAAEIQRTTFSLDEQLDQAVEVGHAMLVGSPAETQLLAEVLDGRIDASVSQTSASELIDGEAGEAIRGAFAPLIAAIAEQARGTQPAIDFLHPKRPVATNGPRNRIIAAVAAVLLLAGGGAWHINGKFEEVRGVLKDLKSDRSGLNEQVSQTKDMRSLAKGLMSFERTRMNWLDEIRDLTVRMPSSPELSVRQFAATPSGSGFTVTFQGTTKSPDAHRRLELGIQDRYHTTRTPSLSEGKSGKDTVWNFRTTLQIKPRSRKSYTAHRKVLTSSPRRTPETTSEKSDSKDAASDKTGDTQKNSAAQTESKKKRSSRRKKRSSGSPDASSEGAKS